MARTIYLDDEDEGLSPESSHPRFVELAPESFFDESKEFGPFGNDDGWDALRAMEEWFEDSSPRADPAQFLEELLDEWALEVPENAFELDGAALSAALDADEELERRLTGVANATVAAALGQVKIAGVSSPALVEEGKRALRLLRALASDTSRYPDWPHRDEALEAYEEIAKVLEAL